MKNYIFNIKRWNKRKIGISSLSILILAGIGTSMFAGVWLDKSNSQNYGSFMETSFVPNTNVLNDLSFNHETHNGFKEYSKQFQKDFKVFTPNSNEPSSSDYRNIFEQIKDDGASKGILTNGFKPVDSLLGSNLDPSVWPPNRDSDGWLINNPNYYTIVLDDGQLDGQITVNGNLTNINNGISVTYDSSHAGFFAGLSASLYAIANTQTSEAKVSTWGGMQFSNVFDWLSGYEQGINFFNYAIMGVDVNGNQASSSDTVTTIEKLISDYTTGSNLNATLNLAINPNNPFNANKVDLITPGTISHSAGQKIDYSKNSDNYTTALKKWYSGNFTPGGGESLTQNAESAGATVLFPVAGPQTADALNLSKSSKVIGVDTDITSIYSTENHKNKILGSAIKNLEYGGLFTIWYVERWTNEFMIDDSTGKKWEDDIEENSVKKMNDIGTDADYGFYSRHLKGRTFNQTTGALDKSSVSERSWLMENDKTNDVENKNDMFENDHFLGNYLNGGVSYTTNGFDPDVNDFNKITNLTGESDYTFEDFVDDSFNSQVGNSGSVYIEKSSPTFSDQFNVSTSQPTSSLKWMLPNVYMTRS